MIDKLTEVVRKADEHFEKVGGSSRHWVRECFLPELEAAGLKVVSADWPDQQGTIDEIVDTERCSTCGGFVRWQFMDVYFCDDCAVTGFYIRRMEDR